MLLINKKYGTEKNRDLLVPRRIEMEVSTILLYVSCPIFCGLNKEGTRKFRRGYAG